MNVALVNLTELRQKQGDTTPEAFRAAFPGAFLLAMGFVSAELIRARAKPQMSIEASKGGRLDATSAVTFGAQPKHVASGDHPLAGLAFFLEPTPGRAELVIGRGPHCDITVPEESISDEHCRLEVAPDGVMVVDLGSTNGTSINLGRLTPDERSLIADEDVLTLGRYSFQLLAARTMYSELQLLNELDG